MNILARRLLSLIPLLLGSATLVFVVAHVIPSDPVAALIGERVGPEQIAQRKSELGLDKPLHVQYAIYMAGLARGDLGVSIGTGRPVLNDLLEFLPATLELLVIALLVAYPVGVAFGMLSATMRERVPDLSVRLLAQAGASAPLFWFALVLQLVFYRHLGWFPAGGRLGLDFSSPPRITGFYTLDSLLQADFGTFLVSLRHLALPALSICFFQMAMTARIARASILEVLGMDFVRTARSKGLNPFSVLSKHVLRNALVPLVTLWGVEAASLMSTTVVVEAVFGWPGLGKYAVDAVLYGDFPSIIGVTILMAIVFSVASLLADMAYLVIDPRMRARQ